MSKITIKQREYIRQRLDSVLNRLDARRKPATFEPMLFTPTHEELLSDHDIVAKFMEPSTLEGTYSVTLHSILTPEGRKRWDEEHKANRERNNREYLERQRIATLARDRSRELMDIIMLSNNTPENLISRIADFEKEMEKELKEHLQ